MKTIAIGILAIGILHLTAFSQERKAESRESTNANQASTSTESSLLGHSPIPAALRLKAEAAQKEGKVVFIWTDTTNAGMVMNAPFGATAQWVVRYARLVPSDKQPFKIYTRAVVTDSRGEQQLAFGSMWADPKTNDVGTASAILQLGDKSLHGKGKAIAIARKVQPDGKTLRGDDIDQSEFISNELELYATFPDY